MPGDSLTLAVFYQPLGLLQENGSENGIRPSGIGGNLLKW